MGDENIYWLEEWRRKREERKNLVIPLAAESFGGSGDMTPVDVCQYMNDYEPVVAIVYNGTHKSRKMIHQWFDLLDETDRFSYDVVSEYDIAAMNLNDFGKATGVLEMIIAITNFSLRTGKNVLLDVGNQLLDGNIERLGNLFFYNGARAVIVIDPTGDYGDWEKDGITGAVWADGWKQPEIPEPEW